MGIVACFQGRSAPDKVEAVKDALAILVHYEQNSPGTIRCEGYQSKDDPTLFIVFGIWESEADLAHFGTSEAHDAYVKSLPVGAWAEGPKRIVLQAL